MGPAGNLNLFIGLSDFLNRLGASQRAENQWAGSVADLYLIFTNKMFSGDNKIYQLSNKNQHQFSPTLQF